MSQAIPIDLCVNQFGNNIFARVVAAGFAEARCIHIQLGCCHGCFIRILALILRIISTDHSVGPVKEQVAILVRHAHDLGNCLQRKLRCKVSHKVAGSVFDDLINDQLRAKPQVLFNQSNHARSKALVDQEPVSRMARRVGHQHDLAAHIKARFNIIEFNDVDPVGLGAKPLGVAIDQLQVSMLGN